MNGYWYTKRKATAIFKISIIKKFGEKLEREKTEEVTKRTTRKSNLYCQNEDSKTEFCCQKIFPFDSEKETFHADALAHRSQKQIPEPLTNNTTNLGSLLTEEDDLSILDPMQSAESRIYRPIFEIISLLSVVHTQMYESTQQHTKKKKRKEKRERKSSYSTL